MALESSPICFRLNAEDRELLEMVAKFHSSTLSNWIREVSVREARKIWNENHTELLEVYKKEEAEAAAEWQRRSNVVKALASRQTLPLTPVRTPARTPASSTPR